MIKYYSILLDNGKTKYLTISNLVNPEKCGNIPFTTWLKLNLEDFFGEEYNYYNIVNVKEIHERETQLYIKVLKF